MEALLHIDLDMCQGYDQFLRYFQDLQMVENEDDRKFDARKYNNILTEFKHLMSKREYNLILKDFKQNAKTLIKQTLETQNLNNQSPLHVASYFGDFKATRHMVNLGADATSD